jgi:outer membrane protein assembly factor BamB
MVLAGCPQERQAEQGIGVAPRPGNARALLTSPSPTVVASGVTLTLDTLPVSTAIFQGETFAATMSGAWQTTGAGTFYLQVSDSAGLFVAPAPMLPTPKKSTYGINLVLPTSTGPGVYSGTLSVRACEDSLCANPYSGTLHSVGYTVTVNKVGDWETVQRTSGHDGYVPITIDAARYGIAWSFESSTTNSLSGVVTDGNNVYFAEPGSASIYAKRATDGVSQWRRVFTGTYGPSLVVNPPTVSSGVVYAATTSEDDTWVHALRASDGLQSYQSQFATQWGSILNPTVRNGKVYVNAGYYTGVVYAFNIADGSAAWNASGGTYGMNTPAVDDHFVYAYNGATLNVFNAADGSLSTSIGPSPGGTYVDYNATPMLGSADHVLTYSGAAGYYSMLSRQLLDYSVANGAVRWMSNALYSTYPAVAKGVVYAASNESHTLDALDEATGRLLWSWTPPEPSFQFTANIVVANNVVFVSTSKSVYAIDLRRHSTVWSASTPGTVSISGNRMLFVSSPSDGTVYPATAPRITAYRLN